MLETRRATAADANIITHHRRRMFIDAGRPDDQVLSVMSGNFEPWVAKMIDEQKYIAWLTVDGDRVVAGAGLLILDWPPHPLDPGSVHRGYLLNMYVDPEYRRRKLGRHLIDLALAEASSRGIHVVALHATDEGRHLYQSCGFRESNEMYFIQPLEV